MHNHLKQESDTVELIKVATFNLFNFIEPPSAYYDFENIYTQEQWQKKLAWITSYLNEHQPDVIGFQEVFSPDALATLTQACGLDYFAVLDEPDVFDDFIYSKPVVAIASRYPIIDVHSVEADSQLAEMVGMPANFSFSRKPLRATVSIPKLGPCDCYVVHFKSKRPLFDAQTEYLSGKSQVKLKTGQLLAVEALAQWGASIVRGSEAALLRHAMVERRVQTQYPMMLMGDFNDGLEGGVLASLTSVDTRIKPDNVFGDVTEELQEYQLQDSYELYQKSQYSLSSQQRPATYYYLAAGSVLDYILLSCEFDAKHSRSLAEVGRYETYDRHLINPSFDRDSQSTDHAPVMITLSIRH
ncbi:endonuclease/exonuclease/phosphatase family protein [Shewanella woodyi]|uniref:Endonuclease/exonuclease/phosphatase n=1 Tax=Shewanella woodyi (strain ATCC 51908 / MS32) TaxID=392500 RepID=B1KEU5_SHEWM|nr:endonuclease/exonuclease/phosphatase family protein [Shewanella woodyi]ACA85096.1 Endonuclease/exonuclease/phosphatase [Shewanella woodyi ATCC 51908]